MRQIEKDKVHATSQLMTVEEARQKLKRLLPTLKRAEERALRLRREYNDLAMFIEAMEIDQ